MSPSPQNSAVLLLDSDYQALKQFIINHTGLVYYINKDTDLAKKIKITMEKWKISSFHAFLAALRSSPQSAILDDLVSGLTIGETYFFREKEILNKLVDIVLPAIIKKNGAKKQIRIWSAGCATGEEAYTLSMILRQEFGHLLYDWDIRIIGTDIDHEFLSCAIEGKYKKWSFRRVTEDRIFNCFDKIKDAFFIKEIFKKDVSFQYHNLVKNPFPSLLDRLVNFDLILCRNVMIYFDTQTIQTLIHQFQETLCDQGWLVVGHADHIPHVFKLFKTVIIEDACFYQNVEKDPSVKSVLPDLVFPAPAPGFEKSLPGTDSDPEVSCFKKQIKGEEGPADLLREKETQLLQIAQLINRGDLVPASGLCEKLLKTHKLDEEVYFYHGLLMEQSGKMDLAESAFKKSVYLNRNFVLGHYHLGLFYQSRSLFKPALKSFDNVLNLLETCDNGFVFKAADNMTASQLRELTRFQIEVLQKL